MPQPHKRNVNEHFGPRLALARTTYGLSQRQLAKAIGVTVGAIQAYEHGRSRIPAERLEQMARVLQQEPGDLLKPSQSKTLTRPNLIIPPNLGFYSRRAHSQKVDADTTIHAACGLPADAPSHLAWEHWYSRIHPENRAAVDIELAHLYDPNQGTFAMQYRLVGHDGVERCIIDLARMRFEADRPLRLQGAMLDITHESKTTAAANKRNAFVEAIKEYLKAAVGLLFPLLHCGNKVRGIEANRLGQFYQLDDIQTPIAALKAGDPGLRSFELLGQLNLPDIGALALGNHQFDQPFMTLAMYGFHLF
jgi:transcriptional regulator with XRE-family HTH domain